MKSVRLVAAASALCLAACAVSPNPDLTAFARASQANSFEVTDRKLDSPDALVLPVVHDRQTARPSCGAHALASVVNYWAGATTVAGETLYRNSPPKDANGYSMSELLELARSNGLLASAVRLGPDDVIAELENGRPVLVPVRLPSVYVQKWTLPGSRLPVADVARSAVVHRAGRVSEWSRMAMVNHYMLVVGYEPDAFVVVEPVMGYRTISAEKLARYRQAFGNAALVFSANAPAARTAGLAGR